MNANLTQRLFLTTHGFLRRNPILQDIAVIVLRDGEPLAVVNSSVSGVTRPWCWATEGWIRMNSTVKIFTSAELLERGLKPPGLAAAIEHSDNGFFIAWGEEIGPAAIEARLAKHGLTNRRGFSLLGRIEVRPLDLAKAADDCIRNNPALKSMLVEVPRRGTAASALLAWPGLPRSTFAKSGTSPQGRQFLIVGGAGKDTVLIWANANEASYREAGPLLGPLFAEVIKITTKP